MPDRRDEESDRLKIRKKIKHIHGFLQSLSDKHWLIMTEPEKMAVMQAQQRLADFLKGKFQ